MSYVNNDALAYFWSKIKAAFASKANAISNITRNGTTFTATRADGTTFTFDQQDTNTTYENASTSAAGLMSASDKSKLNGIEAGAQKHIAPTKAEVTTALGYTPPTTDTNTTYTLTQGNDGHVLTFTPSDGSDPIVITIPDNDTKALGSMTGTLAVDHGGTGVATLTGIVKGNGTNAMSAATASDVKTLLGTTAVNRATADASGNNISDTYAKKTDIAGIYKYIGSVANEAGLPSTGQSTGDVYNIETASSYGAPGANVAWNGTSNSWDTLGEVFAITNITNSEIDTIVAN